MGLRLHERELLVRKAEGEVRAAFLDALRKHDLTGGEELRVVSSVLADYLQTFAKYAIREERHGDASKAGGLQDG